jgi:hypothetical protein
MYVDFLDFKQQGVKSTIANIFEFFHKNSSIESGPWIAGGVGRQLAIGEREFNDIDIWFSSREQFQRFKEGFIGHFGDNVYRIFDSENAETWQVITTKVQFIKKEFFKNSDDVLEHFDFTCCQILVDGKMNIRGNGIKDAKNRVLKVNKLDHTNFLSRYAKYVSYGYVMDPTEFIKIIETADINYEFDGTTIDY